MYQFAKQLIFQVLKRKKILWVPVYASLKMWSYVGMCVNVQIVCLMPSEMECQVFFLNALVYLGQAARVFS